MKKKETSDKCIGMIKKLFLLLALALFIMAAPVGNNMPGSTFSVTAEAATKLSTPVISSVSNTTSGVKVKWKKVSGAKGYYIYRRVSTSDTYKKIGTVKSGSTLTYTNKNSGSNKVSSGKTYYYKVVAYSGSKTSSRSSAKSIKYLAPGKVSSLSNTSSGIKVKWSKVSGAKGYYVYRKTSSGSYKKIKTITSGSTLSYTDTAVKSKSGTTYKYAVRPYYGNTKGSYAAKSTVRLSTPSLSSLDITNCVKLKPAWKKVSGAGGYQIQYSTSSSFPSDSTTTVKAGSSDTSKTVTLPDEGTYYVRIRAYKTVNDKKYYSAWSSSQKATGEHTWKETGYYETVTVTDQAAYQEKYPIITCNICGATYGSYSEWTSSDCYGYHGGYTVSYGYINHEAVTHTEQQWVSTGYKCSVCGTTK